MSDIGNLGSIVRQIQNLTSAAHKMLKAGNLAKADSLLKQAQELAGQHPELIKHINPAQLDAKMAEAGFEAVERQVAKQAVVQGERIVARQAAAFVIRGVAFTMTEALVIIGVVIVIAIVCLAIAIAVGSAIGDKMQKNALKPPLQSMLDGKVFPKSPFIIQPGRVG